MTAALQSFWKTISVALEFVSDGDNDDDVTVVFQVAMLPSHHGMAFNLSGLVPSDLVRSFLG